MITTIQDYHRSYNPLAYSIFFLFGMDELNWNTKSLTTEKKVTLCEYLRYHMTKRNNHIFFLMASDFFNDLSLINVPKLRVQG